MGNWTKQNFLKRRNSNGQKHMKKCLPSLAIKEMQVKTTLRFHFTPFRIAIINNTNNRYWQGCVEKGTLIHWWWECKQVQPLWKTIWRFLKKLNIDVQYDPAILLLGIYPKECNSGYFRHTHVYCSTIHNSPVMETAKMSHYWQMD
jgi:hypothetical protein